jgi:hypothetical protein
MPSRNASLTERATLRYRGRSPSKIVAAGGSCGWCVRSLLPTIESSVDGVSGRKGAFFLTDSKAHGRPVVLSDRQGFDRRWFATNLQAVYVPTHAEQVADHVTTAIRAYGRDVKVASGRHCYENFVYNASTRAVIDMSALNQVGLDPDRNAFFVDAGCENWTVYRTLLNAYNKTLPAGSRYSSATTSPNCPTPRLTPRSTLWRGTGPISTGATSPTSWRPTPNSSRRCPIPTSLS